MQRGRGLHSLLVLVLVAFGVGLASTSSLGVRDHLRAAAASPDDTSLPVMFRDDPPEAAAFGTAEFVISPVTTVVGADDPHRDVVRVSDGATVRTVRAASLTALAEAPSIVDNKLITRVETDVGTTVKVVDLTTDQKREYTLPRFTIAAVTYPEWAVTVQRADGGVALFLQRADGTRSMVAGPYAYCSTINLRDSDADGVIFRPSCGEEGFSLLTVSTGTVEPAPGSMLTPHRVMSALPVDGGYEVSWAPRDDLAELHTTTVAVADRMIFATLGDGLVAREPASCGTERCGGEIREVDLATGALGETLVSNVLTEFATPDGSVLVTVDDGGTGALVLVGDGDPPRRFLALRAQPAEPLSLGLSGDRVVASSRELLGNPIKEYTGGAWTTVSEPSSGGPLTAPSPYRDGMRVADATIAIKQLDDRWKLVWPGGTRTTEPVSSLRLGHHGDLVALTSYQGSLQWRSEVQDVRTGETVWTGISSSSTGGPAIDGRWVWHIADDHTLEGIDTTHPGSVRRVKVDCQLTDFGLDVRGRWALSSCGSGHAVVDLLGVMEPHTLDAERQNGHWRLGNDFAYEVSGNPVAPIKVTDFSPAHEQRLLGPGIEPAAADDAGAHVLVWADQYGRLVRTDLDWVTVPPASGDRTAPRLVSTGGSARYVRAVGGRRPVTFKWTFTDPSRTGELGPSGVASYDVRWRVLVPNGVWGSWSTRSKLTERSVTRIPRQERTVCYQVRGRDRAGNLSPWSARRCTSVDGKDPTITRAWARIPRPSLLVFNYRARDTFGVSHFIVRYRRGSNAARWVTPKRWRHLTKTSVTLKHGVRRTCFKVIAVDRVGHRDAAVRCVRGR